MTPEPSMRRDLLNQITALEEEISTFIGENCPYDPMIRSSPNRGPGILTVEQLELVRDELVVTRAELHDRFVVGAMNPDAHLRPKYPRWMQRFKKG